MGKRLPTILGKAIDDTIKTLNEESEEERIVDLVRCIERMEDLMDDLHQNVGAFFFLHSCFFFSDWLGCVPLWITH